MKPIVVTLLSCVFLGNLCARDSTNRITPEIQNELNAQKRIIAEWAATPVLVSAVREQNKKGPILDMSNSKWRKLNPDDPVVRSLQTNAAGELLTKKISSGNGLYREAFLCAALGEKAAFAAKPTSYIHTDMPKFSVPMSGGSWQGVPEFDKSSHSHVVQLSTPVLDRGKPIGVLVVGISMKAITGMARQ